MRPVASPTVTLGAGRDTRADVARGIAIIAIVFGHALRGVAAAGLLDADSAAVVMIDRTVYLFHLVVFAFLAGVFARSSVQRDPRTAVVDRATRFLYLYVVWSLLQGAVKLIGGEAVNREVTLLSVLDLSQPEGQLWFLPWIVLASTLLAVGAPFRSKGRAVVVLTLGGLLALAAWGWDPGIIGAQGLALLPFFLAGSQLGASHGNPQPRRLFLRAVPMAVMGLGVLLLVGVTTNATAPTSYFESRTVGTVALGVVGAVAGLVGVLAMASLLARVPLLGGGLAALGRSSLEIFLAHILFTAATRILMQRIGVEDGVFCTVAATVLGLMGPLILAAAAKRLRLRWLFAPPRSLGRLAGRRAAVRDPR